MDQKTNDECKAEFRFYREDIYKLAEQLQLPDEITTYNGLVVASVPALCMYLKRYAYPCRYGDLLYHFARPVPELSIITNHMMDLIYYGSREGTIQKYFANPKKCFKSQYFSQITVEKFDRSKKLLQILRKFVDPQITFSIIRK